MSIFKCIYQSVMGLSVNNRIAFFLRVVFMFACFIAFLSGKPPAKAASQQPIQSMITSEDSQQNIQLTKMGEFKTNQEDWNRNTGQKIGEVDSRLRQLEQDENGTRSEIRGWFGALTALSALAIFFQLKKKST